MPSWSDSERNKMFLAMIELMAPHGSNNKLPSWTLVAERMESGFTGEAVRQQFQKCRKEGLPRQIPPRNSSGKATSSRSRNGKRFSAKDFDDDEEASLYSTSKKRVKIEADRLLAADIGNGAEGEQTGSTISDGATAVKKEPLDESEGGLVQG